MSKKITGQAVALVSKYTKFDPANPTKAQAHEFTLVGENSALEKDGTLRQTWSEGGYIMVGRATIEVELLDQKSVTGQAVKSLRKRKTAILAEAQAEATRIEGQIQNLLAITFEG